MRRRILRADLALVACLAACGNQAPTVTAPAAPAPSAAPGDVRAVEPPDDPVPALKTGAVALVEAPPLELTAARRFVADGMETLDVPFSSAPWLHVDVGVDGASGDPTPVSFVLAGAPIAGTPATARVPYHLWVKRPVTSTPVTGDFYVERGREPGLHLRFRVSGTQGAKLDPALPLAWLKGLGGVLGTGQSGAWGAFASLRIAALVEALEPKARASKPVAPVPRARVRPSMPPPRDDLADLMATTTGASAVQEALQDRRALFLGMAREKATVPLASLAPPALGSHPWARMAAALPPPPAEPMATCAPADFYFVRAVDLTALFRLLDEIDAWGSAAATAMEHGEDRELAARYGAALGLKRGPLTRALGPGVLGQVAVFGSDPYVREGSDVTVAMQVKSRALLDAALASTLSELEGAHGTLVRATREHGGVTVSVARSPDGAVVQQRASAADLELVSNSASAIDAALDAIAGKRPRLSDEPDFRYMLARDAGTPADVLAYLGDRFVGDVVGPRQKVLEARREIAQGELLTPGFAALLYGAVHGKSPASAADLVASGLLGKDELAHADGAKIRWTPGAPARSAWGTVASMTPLADLPAITTVTPSEKAGYERFSRDYQASWRAYVDPVAIRVALHPRGLDVDLRQLPLIDGTSYRDLADFVQRRRVLPGPLDGDALRFVVAVGPDSRLRRDFSRTLRGVSSQEIKLDWIGDWAAAGVMDRASVAKAYLTVVNDAPQLRAPPPGDADDFEALSALPLYAEISVKSAAQAALALAAVRVAANETIPGLFEWGQDGAHRGVPIVRVTIRDEVLRGGAPGQQLSVYYAVTEGALLVSLQRWLLERLVDEQLDGTGPGSQAEGDAGSPDTAQLAMELATRAGKALASVVGWMLESKLLESTGPSRPNAVALFRGAPGLGGDPAATRALALAYFGAVPLTPDGAPYELSKQGPRDPARGTAAAPVWPAVPVPGSPVARLLESLASVHSRVAFDDEGKDDAGTPMRSLHVRASFGLADR